MARKRWDFAGLVLLGDSGLSVLSRRFVAPSWPRIRSTGRARLAQSERVKLVPRLHGPMNDLLRPLDTHTAEATSRPRHLTDAGARNRVRPPAQLRR